MRTLISRHDDIRAYRDAAPAGGWNFSLQPPPDEASQGLIIDDIKSFTATIKCFCQFLLI